MGEDAEPYATPSLAGGMEISGRLMSATLADEIEFLTARARSVGTGHANLALANLGLKVRGYAVLSLATSGLNPSQRELAAFLRLDASQIVALIDELQQRKLVKRSPDPRDRRTNFISATKSGHELYQHANEAVRAAEGQSLDKLTEDERGLLRSLLRRIAFEVE